MDIRRHPQDMGHLPILYYPRCPPGTLNSLMVVGLIPTHVGRGLRPKIVLHQFPPMVRTYLKSTAGGVFGSRLNPIAFKLLSKGVRYRKSGHFFRHPKGKTLMCVTIS